MNSMETFIRELIDTGSRQRLPELFASAPSEALYHVPERNGVSVVALHSTSLREEQLVKLLKYRWAQYLHPAVGFRDTRRVSEMRQEHEPLSEELPNDVHVIAGTVETGQILCYSVLRFPPAAPPGTTLRTRERPLFPVEKVHGWGIYNRLRVLPDLPLLRIRELGRFVKNQQCHTFDVLGARGPVEVVAAVMRLLLGPLRRDVDAIVGDLEEGVSKQNFDFFHFPTLLIRGTVPYECEESSFSPRYQSRTVYPAAVLVADIEAAVPRLEAIERALELPGKPGLKALFALKHESRAPKSRLKPPEGLPALAATPVPQPELAMPARRAMLDLGARLRSTGLFQGLSVAEAALLGSLMERREIPEGQLLLRQGEPGDDFYLIEAGEAEVRLRKNPSGGTRVLARCGPGDHVGEIALLNGGARTADVVALTPLTVLRLAQSDYAHYLTDLAEMEQPIARTAASRAGEVACLLRAHR